MTPTLPAAVRALAAGDLVVYPTDTLLGLGARAADRSAVLRLETAKGRPGGQPISVAVSSVPELEALGALAPSARRFVRTHLPGPYTVFLRPSPLARRTLAPRLFAADGSLGVRVPDHSVARELALRVGPITATSANRHGAAPCRTPAEARRAFGRDVRVYLPARPAPSGSPSTLIDLTGAHPRPVARK